MVGAAEQYDQKGMAMNYNPNRADPPDLSMADVVTCEQCQEDVLRFDADNIGDETSPVWICRGTSCMKHYATDVTAEFQAFRRRSQKLMQQVTSGIGPGGHHDFGRYDIAPDGATGSLVLISKPDTGQYRIIQLGGGE